MENQPENRIEEVLRMLNHALKADRRAIQKAFTQGIECNQDIANDPYIQVYGKDGKFFLGLLGSLMVF
jgi:hypothetical protein